LQFSKGAPMVETDAKFKTQNTANNYVGGAWVLRG
jgi:hypothetical protein